MADFITKIHLLSTSGIKEESIDINDKLTLPPYLDDDRPVRSWVVHYELQSRTIAPNTGHVEASYLRLSKPPQPTAVRMALTYLLHQVSPSRLGLQNIIVSNPTWQLFQSPPVVYSKPFTINWVDEAPMEQSMIEHLNGLSAEPECKCDVRALLGNGHESGCQYKQWKDSKR